MRALNDVSLRTKVLAAIFLVVLPLGLSIVSFTVYAKRDERADTTLTQERKFRIAVAAIVDLADDANSAARGFVVTGRSSFLRPYEHARRVLPARVTVMEANAQPEDRGDVALLKSLLDRQFESLAVLVDEERENTRVRLEQERLTKVELEAIGRRMIASTEADMDALIAERAHGRSQAYRLLIVGGGLGAIASIGAAVLLVGSFVSRVQKNTENARRLAEGGELFPAEEGSDELAELSRRLHQTALLLRARESSLREAQQAADRANRAKSEFLSRMSHELRTPLNAVIGFAQLLRDDLDDARSEDVLEILRAGKHLLSLIDEVLDLSRIETGMLTMSVEPVSVMEIVNEAIPLVRGLASERHVEVRIPELRDGPYVMADHQRLKQVVVNLLSNAVKYNRDGGAVDIAVTEAEDRVRLEVSDQGSGIPLERQQDLFIPFSRLGAENTSIEGTGLGLALSKHLVGAMDGEMGLDSVVGVGSTFWVELPRSVQPTAVTTEEITAPISDPPPTEPVAGLTILQFEDNPSNVRLIERALRSRGGIDLRTAMTGREGLELLARAPVDLILLDVNLPDMSGRDVLIRLRANPPTRGIPVVVLSADATEAQIEQMLALGAERYLTKPLDMNELNDVLDDVARRADVAEVGKHE